MDATVLIATYNRAGLLAATLDSLAAIKVPRSLRWDVIVVDNNSSDETAQVVQGRAGSFPVPLRWLFEPRQGKSHALNSGMAASAARIFALTDDDVRVSPEWLEAGVRPLLERTDIAYTGGQCIHSGRYRRRPGSTAIPACCGAPSRSWTTARIPSSSRPANGSRWA